MKIKDLLSRDTLSLSFEVFPPKTESGFDSVKTATEEIISHQTKRDISLKDKS